MTKQVSLDITLSRYDLDLWPLTMKNFSPMATHMAIICVKFRGNPSTKLTEEISRHDE